MQPMEQSIKKQSWVLSASGMTPFIICIILHYMGLTLLDVPPVQIFRFYSAIILSFLGGVIWIYSLTSHKPKCWWLSYSVMPSLVALFGITLPDTVCLLLYMTAFGVHYLIERRIYDATLMWFMDMRAVMTALVITLHSVMMALY